MDELGCGDGDIGISDIGASGEVLDTGVPSLRDSAGGFEANPAGSRFLGEGNGDGKGISEAE